MNAQLLTTGYYQSPVGWLELVASATTLVEVSFLENLPGQIDQAASNPIVSQTQLQLDEYFSGQRRQFELPVAPSGTLFQRRVWQALREVPFGKTASYLEIAQAIGSPRAMRAVGQANGHNPIVIVIPCHRIIAHNGQLGGYSSGLERKQWLLQHETGFGRHSHH